MVVLTGWSYSGVLLYLNKVIISRETVVLRREASETLS